MTTVIKELEVRRNGKNEPIYFAWDSKKAQINKRKHGLEFTTAMRIFADEYSIDLVDEKHSKEEERYIKIGREELTGVLFVIYTERYYEDELLVNRIISARLATPKEEGDYYRNREILLECERRTD